MTHERSGLRADERAHDASTGTEPADPDPTAGTTWGGGGSDCGCLEGASLHRRYASGAATGRPVGRYSAPSLNELPDDMQARIVAVDEKLGFVPNVFWMLARRPAEFRAFFGFFDALMLKESGVTKAEREMIVVATTALSHSVYCTAHHGAILRLRTRNATIADQIATNYRRASLRPRQLAMLDFAVKVATESHAISEADFGRLAEHGFTDEDAWDIGAITAFFAFGSRMANLTDMRPNDEFYALGRGSG